MLRIQQTLVVQCTKDAKASCTGCANLHSVIEWDFSEQAAWKWVTSVAKSENPLGESSSTCIKMYPSMENFPESQRQTKKNPEAPGKEATV